MRRVAILLALALVLAACGGDDDTGSSDAPDGTGSGDLIPYTLRIGRQPPAGMSAVISQYMADTGILEEFATEAGYDLTVEWQNFPSAQPMIDAMVADRLDMGLFGATPVIRSIAGDIGILPIAIGLGRENQFFTMRNDGTVQKPEDLRGKRIGLIVGGEQQVFLANVLQATFGTADLEELDIELISLENQGQTCSVPEGTDITLCINSVGLPKIQAGEVTWPFDMFGNTGPAYVGPAGEGEGFKVPEVENSPYNPEGFFLARAWWVATTSVIDEAPELIQAFVAAEQAALDDLKAGTSEEAAALISEDLGLDPEVAGPMLEDDLLWIRGWVWPTESDYWGMVANSVLLQEVGALEAPMTWDELMTAIEPVVPLVQGAYDGSGMAISDEEFTTSDLDLRGLPVWRSDEWSFEEG